MLAHDSAFPVEEEERIVEALVIPFIDAGYHVRVIFLCHLADPGGGFARNVHGIEKKLGRELHGLRISMFHAQ